MKATLYVQEIREVEKAEVEKGLRSNNGFVLRRSQIIQLSSMGKTAPEIAELVGCHEGTVRKVIHGFNARGVAVLKQGSKRPHNMHRAFTEETEGKLRDLLHESPRKYGKDSSLWTLSLLAEVSFEQGLTKSLISDEAIRKTLKRMGINWKRAKHWITSPDPLYEHKKNDKKN